MEIKTISVLERSISGDPLFAILFLFVFHHVVLHLENIKAMHWIQTH